MPSFFSNTIFDSVDIDGGTIDNTDITVGNSKTLDVSAGTLTLAADQISGNAINGGTIGSITISQLAGAIDCNSQAMTNAFQTSTDFLQIILLLRQPRWLIQI